MLFAEDYKDDKCLNDSNISNATKKKRGSEGGDISQGYHHETAKSSTSLFQTVAMPALISIYKKYSIKVTRQQLQKEHEGQH
ncbi:MULTISPECIES: hypothetical protein [Flavobacterium]|uniref:Uncharacterized protein n=1 Tax=Flavobacterium jumunjinense TaxID=998845 RepID=A0ABV5GQV6_9FLAO|nr:MULTISPECIES: hypothetical protein [Flavobacterium]